MHILLAGSTLQRLRIGSGLVLFAFAATHFLNHAMGLVSLDAMEAMHEARTFVTRSWPGGALLLGALLVHVGLALLRVARRTATRMPPWEALQILSGIAIPLLLIPHVVGTRVAWAYFGVNDEYAYELVRLWPGRAIEQSVLLLLVWVHGCVGLHFWLRLSSWYAPWQGPLLAIAVAIPILALSGFMVAGREIADEALDHAALAAIKAESNWPPEETLARLASIVGWTRLGFVALLALAALSLLRHVVWDFLRKTVEIVYAAGPEVTAPVGPTLLEISRMHRVPHASVCGGRARCSTCRVRVDEGLETLPPPLAGELRTLARIHASPNVRLACQIRPDHRLKVTRLVRPGTRGFARLVHQPEEAQGAERTLAVLFLDVRGFTRLSQAKLPYDVVFILNRLFDLIGREIEGERGWIDKYLGDGLMAVFGRELGAEEGCRQALRAAARIDRALDIANEELASELAGTRIEVGMGIHVGPMVIGEIGYRNSAALTVIGRTVNAAARLEAMTKEEGCQLVASAQVLKLAGLAVSPFPHKSAAVRGLDEPIDVVLVAHARELPKPE